jgi:tetratricopeptide (TPR) repeat protein
MTSIFLRAKPALCAVLVFLFSSAAFADSRSDCVQMQDANRAIDGCTQVLQERNLSTQVRVIALVNRANIFKQIHKWDAAIADYSAALAINPNHLGATFGRAGIWLDQGNFDRAIEGYNEVVRMNPKFSTGFSNRGIAYEGKKDYERALADYNEAVRIDPKNQNARINRSNAWLVSGEPEKAIADADEVIQLNPNNVGAYKNRGNGWLELHNYEKAIADYDMVIKLNPTDSGAFNNRGNAYAALGNYDAAISSFDESIRLDPKNGLAFGNRGDAWRSKGDLDRALNDQNEHIRLNPKAEIAFLHRADTERYRNEFQSALADYDQALSLDPGWPPAFVGRGLTFEKAADYVRARGEFEKAIASTNPLHNDIVRSSLETARSRLDALNHSQIEPSLPSAPIKAANATSIPTPSAPIAPPAVAPQAQRPAIHERRVALVIGNGAYKNVPELSNPANDAEAVANTLRGLGFDVVTLVENSQKQQMISALRGFAAEADRADWAVVYYAGHGMEVSGVNYLLPVDAVLKTDRDIQFEALPLDQVMASIDGAKKLKLVVLDACRNNPFIQTIERTGVAAENRVDNRSTAGGSIGTRSIGSGLGEVRVSGASLVVFSAKHGMKALDGEGANSPFALALVQRLASPGVEVNKMFRLIRDDVMETTAGRQEPYTYGSLPGKEDFYFVEK